MTHKRNQDRQSDSCFARYIGCFFKCWNNSEKRNDVGMDSPRNEGHYEKVGLDDIDRNDEVKVGVEVEVMETTQTAP